MKRLSAVGMLLAMATITVAVLVPSAFAQEAKPELGEMCLPNYEVCLPVAPEVDCEGGGGNGPAFVQGPFKVTGPDIFGLDDDRDGIACEPPPAPPAPPEDKKESVVVVRPPAPARVAPAAIAVIAVPRFTG